MAQRELSLLVTLQDKASQQLKGLEGNIQKMQPTFQKMAMFGTAAFAGVSAGIYKATQSASSAQEIFNRFDVVFGDVSDSAEQVAQDLRNNFGLAESSAKDLLSSTGDMLTGFGMSGEAALDLAEKTNKLAVDLASFTNIEGGAERASKALTKALLGERESVKELGIAILEEDVKAKVEAMKATGQFTDETERQMRALATLEIAVEQSKNAIGDFARTEESLANQQRVLEERTKEMVETLGQVFIPVLADVIEAIAPVVKGISEWIKENPELTKVIVLGTIALSGLVATLGLLGIALPAIITAVGLLGTALFAVMTPVTVVIGAIALLIGAGILLYKNWDKVAGGLIAIWEVIKEGFWAAVNWIDENVIQKMIGGFDYLKEQFDKLKTGFGIVWEDIKTVFDNAIQWIIDHTIGPLLDGLNKIIDLADKAIGAAASVGGKVKGGAILLGETVKGLIPGYAEGGVVTKPTLAMVGEAGPEAIIPLNKMGSGGSIINITVNGDVSGTELVEKVKRQIFKEVNRQIKI